MDGGDLLELLRGVHPGHFQEDELLYASGCIADALAYLERRNIVHRVRRAASSVYTSLVMERAPRMLPVATCWCLAIDWNASA
jgi:hypothetical protein